MIISGERQISYDDIRARIRRAMSGFRALGLAEAAPVAMMLRNDFALFEVVAASAALGSPVVPINWHLKAEEVRYILADSGAKILVCHADLLPQIRDGILAFRSACTIILQARFDAEELLALIERHRVTHIHMVPTMFVRLLRLPEAVRQRYDLSSLRFVVHGAAPCPPDVKRAMIDWWGPVINEYFGSTETGIPVWHSAEEALKKPGTVGRAIEGGIVRIFRDDGSQCGANEVGEIYMRQT